MRETFVAIPSEGSDHAGLRMESARRLGLEPGDPVYVAPPRDPSRRTWLPEWEPTEAVGPDGCSLPARHLERMEIRAGEPVLLWPGRPPGPTLHVLSWTFDGPGLDEEEDEDVLILLDTSASMADGSLRAACRAIHLFVDSLREAARSGGGEPRVGLVAFGGEGAGGVRVLCPPARDRFDEVALQAEGCRPSGLTPMGHALERAAELLASCSERDGASADPRVPRPRRARVVLLSDGYPDDPVGTRKAAERLGEIGARIATVGVGAGFDHGLLATLAARTGGPFLEAARIRDLTRILEELSR